jgi:hypothetical protein
MSLSRHLNTATSPVRRFFDDRLGNTRSLVTEANRDLRAGWSEPPLRGDGNASLVGTAADILLNAWLDPSVQPARQAVSPTAAGAGIIAESQTALMDLLSGDGPPSANEWPALVRHGLLLAAFVTAYRNMQGFMLVRERLEGARPDFADYARRLWRDTDEEDLAALAPAVFEDHASFRDAADIVVNPTFSLSLRLGGADGDLIVDRTLWDYKSSRRQGILGRQEIWQVVGYLLADTADEFKIEMLGFSALRWRARHCWRAVELLAELSGLPTGQIDLPRWRSDFDAVVPQRTAPHRRHRKT